MTHFFPDVKVPTRLMKNARARGLAPDVVLPARPVDRGGRGRRAGTGQGRPVTSRLRQGQQADDETEAEPGSRGAAPLTVCC